MHTPTLANPIIQAIGTVGTSRHIIHFDNLVPPLHFPLSPTQGDKQWSTRRRANNEWRSRQRHLRRVARSRGAAGRAGARDDDSSSLGHGPGTGSGGGPGGGWPPSNEGAGSGHVDLYRALVRVSIYTLFHMP